MNNQSINILLRAITHRFNPAQKAKLRRFIERTRFVIKNVRDRAGTVCNDIEPIFVIGTNRSGASLCTLILNQHPNIEGIFEAGDPSHRITADGHSSSGAEANHIWQILETPSDPDPSAEGILWGLPSNISRLYTNTVSDIDKKILINQLMSARNTNQIPLVMNSHNVLRIPLIKKIFPRSRFVFITRDHQSYIKSCSHKWTVGQDVGVVGSDGYIDYPHIGLHWLLINTIALYDLNKYSPDDFIHINLQDLHGRSSVRINTINRMLEFLKLSDLEVSDNIFDESYVFLPSQSESKINSVSQIVTELIAYERSISHDGSLEKFDASESIHTESPSAGSIK